MNFILHAPRPPMTGRPVLGSDSIQQIINAEEMPLREKSVAPATVNAIFRYGAIIGSSIEHHGQIPRGMDLARQLIQKSEEADTAFPSGYVILADEMNRSKGRFQRSWHAPKGGLWMTLILVNTLLAESSLLLPMAAGIACCELLRDYGIEAYLKWVNDVLAGGKKIAGILTETFTGSRSGEEYVLLGIGINVNNQDFPAGLSGQATSVKACLRRECSLPAITARLLAKLRWNIGLLFQAEADDLDIYGGIGRFDATADECRDKGLNPLLKSYAGLTDIFNRRVVFGFDVRENPQFEARVIGLDRCGGLILELDDRSRLVRHSGEVLYLD